MIEAMAADLAPVVQVFVPIDVVALVTAIGAAIAAVCGPLCLIYVAVTNARAKRIEMAASVAAVTLADAKTKIAQLEVNTNSITTKLELAARREGMLTGAAEGASKAVELAAAHEAGRVQGAATEREAGDRAAAVVVAAAAADSAVGAAPTVEEKPS